MATSRWQAVFTFFALFIVTFLTYQRRSILYKVADVVNVGPGMKDTFRAPESLTLKWNRLHRNTHYDNQKLEQLKGYPWDEDPQCSHFDVKVFPLDMTHLI